MNSDESARATMARVEALRTTGIAQTDPVRLAVVDALARRAAAQQGQARGLLLQRVDRLLAELPRADGTRAASPHPTGLTGTPSALSALTTLVDRLGRARPSAAPAPLNAVTAFKGTWSRLRAEQRLRQALARVPENAGPLHSSHVVHRSFRALHELSPAYLDALMAQVDTLLWLEQAGGADAPLPRLPARPRQRR